NRRARVEQVEHRFERDDRALLLDFGRPAGFPGPARDAGHIGTFGRDFEVVLPQELGHPPAVTLLAARRLLEGLLTRVQLRGQGVQRRRSTKLDEGTLHRSAAGLLRALPVTLLPVLERDHLAGFL